jgi:vancomycin resistance protein VanJ
MLLERRAGRARRFLAAAALAELVGVVAVWVLLVCYGDVWWLATALLFAPRWIWGAPLVVLVPLALLWERRLLAPLGVAALVLLGPVMGFRVPVQRMIRSATGAGRPATLRVMTFNIGGGAEADLALIERAIEEESPDVLALQERNLGSFPRSSRWKQIRCDGELCLYSAFPIRAREVRDRADMLAKNGSGAMIRYELETPVGVINVVNVHLATVREGLAQVMRGRFWRGAPALLANTEQRALESRIASEWAARGEGPVLVMGDFNLPVESAVYRGAWGGFTNAFSEAGLGFGASKRTRWHGIRIDHILAGPGWEVQRAWVGPACGGDHLPMVADLRWVGP